MVLAISALTAPALAARPIVPEMVRVPAGRFVAGSPQAETDAAHYPPANAAREQPQRTVAISKPFAIARTEVTRAAFARFVAETGWRADGPCSFLADGPTNRWDSDIAHDWRSPGFAQDDRHPVVCVNLADAKAYAAWLSRKTGRVFRLPSANEWEYAARAGTAGVLPWPGTVCAYANVGDAARARAHNRGTVDPASFAACDDRHVETAPVGSYRPNRWGLYDMIGNVWEWTLDCDDPAQPGPASDTRPRTTGACTSHIDRGASWTNSPKYVRVAARHPDLVAARTAVLGIRLVEDLR
jgi:formylglycine-generating enzyme required for sulfatase activity